MNATNKTNHTTKLGVAGSLLERRSRGVTCFEQGDRKSQQRGLELVLELVFRVCVRRRKKMGAGISGGGPPWAHEAGAAPRGVGRALHPRCQVAAPPVVIFAQ